MYHTREDEERLFRDIEENARIGREDRKKIIEERRKIENEKFNKLIKKAEKKEDD